MRGMAISDGRAVRARRSVALQNLDLNLLVSLDALLRERSVTRAAAGLGLSQPTLSTALSRLRRHFDDELLTRVGNSYELTPLATDLVERVTGAVGVLERVFAGQPEFDPAVSDREFTVVVSDYAATVLGGPLSELLAAEAPSVCLRFQQMRTETVDAAPESLRAVDGLLLPHGYLTDLPHQDLYDDQWVCMVGAGNEVVGDTFTLEHLHTLPMAVTYREPTRFTPAVKQLHMVGIEPRVVAVSRELPRPAVPRGRHRPLRARPAAPRGPSRRRRGRPDPAVPVPGDTAGRGAVVAPGLRARHRPPVAAHRLRPRPRPSATRDGVTAYRQPRYPSSGLRASSPRESAVTLTATATRRPARTVVSPQGRGANHP